MTGPDVSPDSFGAAHKVWRSLVPEQLVAHHHPHSPHKAQWPQFLIDTIIRMADPTRTTVGRVQGMWRTEVFSTQDFLEEVALELSLKD